MSQTTSNSSSRSPGGGWGERSKYGEFLVDVSPAGKQLLLGAGNFGRTFSAHRVNLVAGREFRESVALKVINPEILRQQSKRLQFFEEINALSRFKNPNLIHIVSCGEEGDEMYVAMELCLGGDLAALSARFGSLPERVVAMIASQVCAGLMAVHDRYQMIHRDIKPTNIVLLEKVGEGWDIEQFARLLEERSDLCKVVDFGLVGSAFNTQEGRQGSRRFVGTPMFASPEQAKNRPLDGRSDLYALGMTMWFLAQGRGPLLDEDLHELGDPDQAWERHLDSTPHSVYFPSNLSQDFRDLLAKMVAKDPDARFRDARETMAAIRSYLENASSIDASNNVSFTPGTLDSLYELGDEFGEPGGHRQFHATHRKTRQRCVVTVVEDLAMGRSRPDITVVADQLNWQAAQTKGRSVPRNIVPISDVILASDALAYSSEEPGKISLGEVLRTRSESGDPIGFEEAVLIFHPVAEALDALVNLGWTKISLDIDEVWLRSDWDEEVTNWSPSERERRISLPLSDWPGLYPAFSPAWTPPRKDPEGDGSAILSSAGSSMGSVMYVEEARAPVVAFLRLLYAAIAGSEIAPLAERIPSAYDPCVNLETGSNNLIRDLLHRQEDWTTLTLIFGELCRHEAVTPPPASQRPDTPPSGSAMHTAPAAPATSVRSNPELSQPRQVHTSSADLLPPPQEIADAALGCEVVGPGIVISPYDPARREQIIPGELWIGKGLVRCEFTPRLFRLPQSLPPLEAIAVAPLLLRSPYEPNKEPFEVSGWSDWVSGKRIQCAYTGRALVLPAGLPLPVASTLTAEPGQVTLPFDTAPYAVDAADWEPNRTVVHGPTGWLFRLPTTLPLLRAGILADIPGMLVSPFAPEAEPWQIAPQDWIALGTTRCRYTGQELQLPPEVEKWEAVVTVIDRVRRAVGNPYRPGTEVFVAAQQWRRNGRIPCDPPGRFLRLPPEPPPLFGIILPSRTPGEIQCPYTGLVASIDLTNWRSGELCQSDTENLPFELPEGLPLPLGLPCRASPGEVDSPYAPNTLGARQRVPAAEWRGDTRLICPVTGLEFILPHTLPLLEAITRPGTFGQVWSPFAPECSLEVGLDDWEAGKVLSCPKGLGDFVLPQNLEPWIVEGTWIPRRPGWIRSPFSTGGDQELDESQWQPKTLIRCLRTRRYFSTAVSKNFPTLALERAAVKYAFATPDDDAKSAARALKSAHPAVTPQLVESIWERHHLASREQRNQQLEQATIVPDKPGVLRSPYPPHSEVQAPPSVWCAEGGRLICPDTGRAFNLPPLLQREPLRATVNSSQPGVIQSPYAPANQESQVAPWDWVGGKTIQCPYSGHAIKLPNTLPKLIPEAKLVPDCFGRIYDPFSEAAHIIAIPAPYWVSGGLIDLNDTRQTKLPAEIPPWELPLTKALAGRAESPFKEHHWISVAPDDWKPSQRLICTATGRPFLLPEGLQPHAFDALAPRNDGTVASPYGAQPRVAVSLSDWEDGKVISDPALPGPIKLVGLPLLAGTIDQDRPLQVKSPFNPSQWMQVDAEDWVDGQQVRCAVSSRLFVLPPGLPLPQLELVPAKPGTVLSPFVKNKEIAIPPERWCDSGVVEIDHRHCRLPKGLPLLVGSIVKRKALVIRSPFNPNQDLTVSPHDWSPGTIIACPSKEGRKFILPAELPKPSLAAVLDQPAGWVISPYDRTCRFHIPPEDWIEGKEVTCPSTALPALLPKKLSPLTALPVPGKVGTLKSPYLPNPTLEVTRRDWVPGGRIKCPATRRELTLPLDLEPWPSATPTPEKAKPPAPPPTPQRESITTAPAKPAAEAQIPTEVEIDLPPLIPKKTHRGTAAWIITGTLAASAIAAYFYLQPTTVDPLHAAESRWQESPDATAGDLYYKLLSASLRSEANPTVKSKLIHSLVSFCEQTQDRGWDVPDPDTLNLAALQSKATQDGASLAQCLGIAKKSKSPTLHRWADRWELDEFKLQHADHPEDVVTEVLSRREGTSGTLTPDEVKTELLKLTPKLSEDYCFNKLLPALENDLPTVHPVILATLKESKDTKIAARAWFTSAAAIAKTSGLAPEAVRMAYLEAALTGHSTDAEKWLFENVVAVPTPTQPGTVEDPFHSGQQIVIPGPNWRPKQQITLPNALFSLPIGPLPALLALPPFHPPKTVDKAGTITNPYTDPPTAFPVPRKNWYPGAFLTWTDSSTNHSLQLRLPEEATFPLLDIAPKEIPVIQTETGYGIVSSPITDKFLKVPWGSWIPGQTLEEVIPPHDKPVSIASLAKGWKAEDIDPKLEAQLAADAIRKAPQENKLQPPKCQLTIKSPYTGIDQRVDLKDWQSGHLILDTTVVPTDPEHKPLLSFKLPEKLPAIPGIIGAPGSFLYWIDGAEQPTEIKLANKPQEYFRGVTDFVEDGRLYSIISDLKFEVDDNSRIATDPRTKAVIEIDAAKKIGQQLKEGNPMNVTLSPLFRDLTEGKKPAAPREASPPLTKPTSDEKGKMAETGDNGQGKGKSNEPKQDPPKVATVSPPPPPPPPPPSGGGGRGNAPRVIRASAGLAGMVFTWSDKSKTWQTGYQLRQSYDSPEERDKNIRAAVNASPFPKGSSFYVTPDGKVVVSPP